MGTNFERTVLWVGVTAAIVLIPGRKGFRYLLWGEPGVSNGVGAVDGLWPDLLREASSASRPDICSGCKFHVRWPLRCLGWDAIPLAANPHAIAAVWVSFAQDKRLVPPVLVYEAGDGAAQMRR